MWQNIIDFFNCDLIVVIGALSTIALIIGSIYTLFLIVTGVMPVWARLGFRLSRGKILIFADKEYETLRRLLVDAKIFKSDNINRIDGNCIAKIKGANIVILNWQECKDYLDQILAQAEYCMPIIVYEPGGAGKIDQESMSKINTHPNSIIANFRGRLLNDVLTSLITSSAGSK